MGNRPNSRLGDKKAAALSIAASRRASISGIAVLAEVLNKGKGFCGVGIGEYLPFLLRPAQLLFLLEGLAGGVEIHRAAHILLPV